MKASSATSAKETPAPRRTARSSAKRRPTPTSAEDFALADPSDAPDPTFNAYRSDLADIALAGRVIASHYAEPAERVVVMATPLRVAPSESAEAVRELAPGDRFRLLDESVGWAWGYGGAEQRVGYVRSETIAAQ